jgi:hypothetical protein
MQEKLMFGCNFKNGIDQAPEMLICSPLSLPKLQTQNKES